MTLKEEQKEREWQALKEIIQLQIDLTVRINAMYDKLHLPYLMGWRKKKTKSR